MALVLFLACLLCRQRHGVERDRNVNAMQATLCCQFGDGDGDGKGVLACCSSLLFVSLSSHLRRMLCFVCDVNGDVCCA